MENLFIDLLRGLGYAAVYMLILFGSRLLKGLFTRYKIKHELTEADNPAMALATSGYFVGVTIVYAAIMATPTLRVSYWDEITVVVMYSLVGILLMLLAQVVNDRILLHSFSNYKELVEDRNLGTGAVVAATYIASGLVTAGAIYGETADTFWQTLVLTLLFWCLGQLALLLFGWVYQRITPYNVHDEIEKDNIAAGVSFAGALIAIGILVMRSVMGPVSVGHSETVDWALTLGGFGIDLIAVVVLVVVARLFFDYVLIAGARLNHEIVKDRNLGAGILEAVILISLALVFSVSI